MQQGFGDVQRRMFWGRILSGAAGHTYGAAGIWHASVEGDPGCASAAFGGAKVYDWTTWKEGMNYPGATQLGLAKRLLEQYPWSRFEPHPEWAEEDCHAAGIPGEIRFIYQPRRGIYNWAGTVVKKLAPGVTYHVFYFDPATGRRFDQGTVTYATPIVKVGNTTAGKTGLWMFQIGERQEFGRFAVSATTFDPPPVSSEAELPRVIQTDEYHAPDLPSPQDWILVLERFRS